MRNTTGNDAAGLLAARRVMDALVGPVSERTFSVRYWDGTSETASPGAEAPFTLVVTSPHALRRACLPPSELRLGEAFVRGDLDIDGDLEEATELAELIRGRLSSPGGLFKLVRRALALPDEESSSDHDATDQDNHVNGQDHHGLLHSRQRDQESVRYHYDVGNEFYQMWLDPAMVYSCAYFEVGDETIDEAQRAKLDHICRKLRLQPGEHLLDIGCGWGALIRHATRCYGARATGITLSPQQAALARERIDAEGLTGRCTVEIMDYRDVHADGPTRQFDKIVSVGMVEHVGRARLATYFRKAYDLLAPGGLFLNHGIVALEDAGRTAHGLVGRLRRAVWRQGTFLDRYVFPDGELVPLHESMRHAEEAGFEPRDVESLREHYALTLRHWVRRLADGSAEAIRAVGADTYRVWMLYMAASAHAFAAGRIGIAQTLLAKPDRHGHVHAPLTRADLYEMATADGGARSVSRKFH
jgi:cyclopropane-fatty-acyl-phospholipid synthase